MKLLRLLPLLLLFALPAFAAAPPNRKPVDIPSALAKNPKLRGFVNEVPDTGQFLPDTTWLVRVGPRVTRAGDFVRSWFESYPEYRPAPDSAGRVQFMTSIVNRDVLALTARAAGKPFDFEDRATLREHTQRVLSTLAYRRMVLDSIHVTDEDARTLWRLLGIEQHLRHILFEDPALAEKVRGDLVAGRISWTEAFRRYHKGQNEPRPDGDLGWVPRDQLEPGIALRVYGLKAGEISKVVHDRAGYHIVQSVERKDKEPPAFAPMRGIMREQMTNIISEERGSVITDALRLRTKLVFDSANVAFAATQFKQTVQVNQQPLGANIEVDAAVPEFTSADTARVLARWIGGGRLTLGELVHTYSEITPIMRPSLNSPDAIMNMVEGMAFEPYLVELAIERGYDKDSVAVATIEKKRDEIMVEHMYQDSIASKVWVDKAARRAYYEKNKSQYFTYASVEFAAILRHSRAAADSVAEALRKGARPEAILLADSLAGSHTGSIQRRREDEHGAFQKVLFEEMRPGQVMVNGPDRSGDFSVVKLLSFDSGHQLTFDEVDPLVSESLQNIKSDEALKAMVARLKKRYTVRSRPELVMQIRLADPSLED